MHNNIVYNEYISDREHVHMNSTQWETLTDFTKWLGREGTAHTPACTPVLTFRMVGNILPETKREGTNS